MKISKEQQMGQQMKSLSNMKPDLTLKEKMDRHIRDMDNVQRLSKFKLLQDYSLTKHCFHTALLFMEIAEIEGVELSFDEIDFVLKHDILETVTGDVLYTAKNYNSMTKNFWGALESQLTMTGQEFDYLQCYTDSHIEETWHEDVIKLFKACDMYELYLFAQSESRLGNKEMYVVIKNAHKVLLNCGIETIEKHMRNTWM